VELVPASDFFQEARQPVQFEIGRQNGHALYDLADAGLSLPYLFSRRKLRAFGILFLENRASAKQAPGGNPRACFFGGLS
jgi:hypothetical protein